ncbi:MAG TPA: hypothetical protein VLF87_01475 [Patescibacteria group bacterium]|nr:hypothetical protein [Patescibacteria group bacterium]
MPNYFYSIVGFVGASLILLGFYRTSIGQWKNKAFWYELDNFMGAGLIVVYQVHTHAYITVVLNVIWCFVAFRGLVPFAERYQFGGKKKPIRRRR